MPVYIMLLCFHAGDEIPSPCSACRERASISHGFPEHICMKLEVFVVWFGLFFLGELVLGVLGVVVVLLFVWVIF